MKDTYDRIRNRISLPKSEDELRIRTIDMHTGGEPLRVIVDGFPEIKGDSILDKRAYCRNNLDHLRKALMFEPRGHADMYGCILLPANDPESDFGILFLHNEGYSTMCGHAIIAISTLAVEMNWIDHHEGDNEIIIEAPCGKIKSFVNVCQNQVTSVRFHCVPSFVVGLDKEVEVPGIGKVVYDLAYGGAFYAYIDMEKNSFDFEVNETYYRRLVDAGMAIKESVMSYDKEIIHPYESELSFLYGTIFIDNSPKNQGSDSRNVCIFADGEVDRCPTGSGVSGRMAIHKLRNEIGIDESMSIESIIGSVFRGSIVSETKYGPYEAVIPQVEGTAHVTGEHTFVIRDNDPFRYGFLLR